VEYKLGDRVMALSHAEKKDRTVYVYGRGVYEGDFPYEDTASTEPFQTDDARSAYNDKQLLDASLPFLNPRIRLDDGKVVWGCECWWGDEEAVDQQYEGWTVVMKDIDEVRKGADGVLHGIPDLVRGEKPA
jgi:hypothetical protein